MISLKDLLYFYSRNNISEFILRSSKRALLQLCCQYVRVTVTSRCIKYSQSLISILATLACVQSSESVAAHGAGAGAVFAPRGNSTNHYPI